MYFYVSVHVKEKNEIIALVMQMTLGFFYGFH
jgi:hypothetical protein